jgi:hypothetical protein
VGDGAKRTRTAAIKVVMRRVKEADVCCCCRCCCRGRVKALPAPARKAAPPLLLLATATLAVARKDAQKNMRATQEVTDETAFIPALA